MTAPRLLSLLLLLLGMAWAQTGRLEPGDAQLDSGEYVDVHERPGSAGETLTIALSSSEFDPYLAVFGPDGTLLLEVDDSDGHGLDVFTTLTLPASGTYAFAVTSATAGETGAYRLDISGAAAGQPFAAFDINEDGWLSGIELESCGCLGYDRDGDGEVSAAEFAANAGAPPATPPSVPGDAPVQPVAPNPAAQAVPAGHYACYTWSMAGMWLSSIEAITVGPDSQYATVGETGTFSADAAGTLRFSGGFLAGRVAHLKESDGKPAIVFIRDENEVGGEPTIDASDTWCYFEPR